MQGDEALGKRLEIKNNEKQVFISICLAAAVVGLIIVGGIYMVRTIMFNATVLEAKAETLQIYRDNTTAIRELNYRVLGLANNQFLEAVAMTRSESCITLDGQLIDFDEDDVAMARVCSALRALPDAMPWRANASALGASMNELLTYPGISVDQTSVGSGTGMTGQGTGAIDLTFNVRGAGDNTVSLLHQIERSIRPIVFNTANFEWRVGGELALSATANAHFVTGASAERRVRLVTMEGNR